MFIPVYGYEGIYEVNEKGEIKSLITNKILKALSRSCDDYVVICLTKDKNKTTHYVHRIVLDSFTAHAGLTPDKEMDVDHIDHNRTNNNLTNLRYLTKTDNRRDITGNKACVRVNVPELDITFPSLSEAARYLSALTATNIYQATLAYVGEKSKTHQIKRNGTTYTIKLIKETK